MIAHTLILPYNSLKIQVHDEIQHSIITRTKLQNQINKTSQQSNQPRNTAQEAEKHRRRRFATGTRVVRRGRACAGTCVAAGGVDDCAGVRG